MKSFCIKTNNPLILDYLLNEFTSMDLDDVYLSQCHFKVYDNLILHYRGNLPSLFYEKVSKIIAIGILLFFEKKLIQQILDYHYFYFELEEKKDILQNCIALFDLENENTYLRYESIYTSIYQYVSEHKSMILDGFVQFRLKDYCRILDSTVDMAVNQFIIDREYREFIEVLQLYIDTKSSINSPIVHLVYENSHAFLLDEEKNKISFDSSMSTTKYLSDISFSSNDYTLNTLLNLLPSKIIIHLIQHEQDEFIQTLQLIFQNRVIICTDCSLCHLYQSNHQPQDGKV